MPKIHEMIESKFIKKEEVDPPVLVTIAGISKQNVAKEGVEPEFKWTMSFQELDKHMVLNVTNLQVLGIICASDDSDEWVGQQVVLYNDPNVSFGGKVVGGIRVRKPKNSKARTAPEKAAELAKVVSPYIEDLDDDIPF